MAEGDWFLQAKVVPRTTFGCQNRSGGPLFARTTFCMTGLRNEAILKRLLSEETLTLKRAVISSEAAARNAKSFNNSEIPGIKRVVPDRGPAKTACKHCGRTDMI